MLFCPWDLQWFCILCNNSKNDNYTLLKIIYLSIFKCEIQNKLLTFTSKDFYCYKAQARRLALLHQFWSALTCDFQLPTICPPPTLKIVPPPQHKHDFTFKIANFCNQEPCTIHFLCDRRLVHFPLPLFLNFSLYPLYFATLKLSIVKEMKLILYIL